MAEDWDKYAVSEATDDDWSQYEVKKKDSPKGSKSGGQPLKSGLERFQGSQPSEIPAVLTPQGQQAYQHDVIDPRKAYSDKLQGYVDSYSGATTKQEKQSLEEAKTAPKQTISQGKDKTFWDDAKLGARYLSSQVLKGSMGLAESGAYLAENSSPMGSTMAPGLDMALNKGQAAAQLNLPKDYEPDSALGRTIGGLAEFAPAVLAAESTGGASYFLQGVGNANKQVRQAKEEGKPFENGSDHLYTLGSGLLNYFFMKGLPISKLVSKVPEPLRNAMVERASMDVLKELSGKPLTAEVVTQTAKNVALSVQDKIKSQGIKYLENYAHTAKTLAGLSAGDYVLKEASNKLGGEENLQADPIQTAENIGHILKSDAPIFAGIGSAGAMFKKSQYRNQVIDELRTDRSDENMGRISQAIELHGQEQGWSPEEIGKSIESAQQIHEAAKAIPKEFGEAKFGKAIDLITGRKELEAELSDLKASKESIDPSIADIPSKEESLLQDKIDQSNDKLRELADGSKFKYFEGDAEKESEKGKFYKQLGESGKKEEIPKSRYELETLEKEFKKKGEENAIQEQTTDEISVQPTPGDSGTLEQGIPGSEPQVATEQGVSEEIPQGQKEINEQPIETIPATEAVQQEPTEVGEVEVSEPNVETEKTPLGVSKAETLKQRTERGLDDVQVQETKTLAKMFDEGKGAVDNFEIDPRLLAQSIMDKPRNLSFTEANALIYDRQRIRQERDNLLKQQLTADEFGDIQASDMLRRRLLHLEELLHANEFAVKAGSRENALALSTIQNMINEDYSLSTQRARMEVKNGGKLSPKQEAELDKYIKELDEAHKRIKELEAKKTERAAKKAVDTEKKAVRSAKKTQDKAALRVEREAIISDFLKEVKKISASIYDISAASAKALEVAAPFMKKMVTNLIKEGVVEFKDIVDRIHEEFKEHINELSTREVQDALAGVYDVKKENKNDLLAQKNAIIRLAKLTTKLEDLEKGLKKEKVPAKARKVRDDILDLEKKIKELEDIAKIPDRERNAVKNRIKQLEESIAEYEQRIKDGKIHPDPKQTKDYNNEQISNLEARREELADELAKMRKEEFTPEERLKNSLKSRIEKLNERLKKGDYSKVERDPTKELDEETITLKARLRKAQNNFDAMAERLDNKNKPTYEKVLDKYTQYRRFAILSGYKTLGKLYSFAAARSITTPIEEVVNSVNSKLPLLKKIAEQSPRFSGGLNAKAEAKAIATRWNKATLKDSWVNVIKDGVGELDRLYGKSGVDKDFDLNPSALEFFGRLHGAFKNSTKRAEFFRSYEKRLQYAAKEGKDISDPNVQFSTALEAYVDGKRAILMNDNLIVDKFYKPALSTLSRSGSSGKKLAAVIRAIFPIIKIPTNYALETYDIATGAIPGLSRVTWMQDDAGKSIILKALTKGAESLTPKEADAVMRTVAKGQIGLGALMIGYFNPQNFGGYYSGKRDKNDLKAGDIELFGKEVPHWLAHNPFLEAMQIGATFRRAIDSANGHGSDSGIMDELTTKNKEEIESAAIDKSNTDLKEPQSVTVEHNSEDYKVTIRDGKAVKIIKEGALLKGGKDVLSGLREQVPLADIGGEDESSFRRFIGSHNPRAIQDVAQELDRRDGEVVKRDPQTLLEQLKVGVPYFRQQVGEKSGDNKELTEFKSGTEVYKLNSDQVKEREKYIQEFVDDFGADMAAGLKEAGKTNKDIERYISEQANNYSKSMFEENHPDGKGLKVKD